MEGIRHWVKPKRKHEGHDLPAEQWDSGPVSVEGKTLSDTEIVALSLEDVESPEMLKRKYPDVYRYLSSHEKREERNIPLAVLTISPARLTEDGSYTPYAQPGKSPKRAALEMARETEAALRELAEDMETTGRFATSKYIFGFSRLAQISERFGFDVFDVKGDAGFDTNSHSWARESYEFAGINAEQAEEIVNRKAAAIALITRKEFIKRYGRSSPK